MTEAELHPIQREMLLLEAGFEGHPPPGKPIDECIAELVGFEGDVDEELDPLLKAEVDRCLRLMRGYYSEFMPATPFTVATIGFLQGVTFAAAARLLKERDGDA